MQIKAGKDGTLLLQSKTLPFVMQDTWSNKTLIAKFADSTSSFGAQAMRHHRVTEMLTSGAELENLKEERPLITFWSNRTFRHSQNQSHGAVLVHTNTSGAVPLSQEMGLSSALELPTELLRSMDGRKKEDFHPHCKNAIIMGSDEKIVRVVLVS
ncbi:Sideroflexin-1 [Manis pentadactyla]|nr:Sideroflexin-1 [Manis pentadactyla]